MTSDEQTSVKKLIRDLEEGNPGAPLLGGMAETLLTEDEWDEMYGGAINQSPLDLSRENRAAIADEHIWTQVEDGEGQDWLINGEFGSTLQDAQDGRCAFNVCGYWLSIKPWSDHDAGDIQAKWGGNRDAEDDEDGDTREEVGEINADRLGVHHDKLEGRPAVVEDDLFAVMTGNPTEGFTVFGPYTEEAEAQYCIDVFTALGGWCVAASRTMRETEDTERDKRATCWIVPLVRGPRQDDDD